MQSRHNPQERIATLEYDEILIDSPAHDAIYFRFGSDSIWLPRSQIEVDRAENQVQVPEWLVVKRGLEDHVV